MIRETRLNVRKTIVVGVAAALLATSQDSSLAQNQRGQIVEGLFRTLLDTHLERERRKRDEQKQRQQDNQRRRDTSPQARPNQPRPAQNRPVNRQVPPANPSRGNVRYGDYQRSLKGFADQSTELVSQLQRTSRGVKGVGPLLGEAWELKATAHWLADGARGTMDPYSVSERYCDLDCQWRNLSYRLRSLNGLDQSATRCIERLDGLSDRLCSDLGVTPQFDRKAMLEQMVMATSYIDTLLDDIEYELNTEPNCEALLSEGRRLQQEIRRAAEFVPDADYDEIANEFTRFVGGWRTLAGKLYPYNNAHINRRLTRIRGCGEQVYSLLWIPPSVDRAYLENVARRMSDDVQQLFEQITVGTLVSLPPDVQRLVLTDGGQMYRRAKRFHEYVGQRIPYQDLRQHFRAVDEQWSNLSAQLRSSQALGLRCRSIDRHHHELRGLLGIPQPIDRQRALQLVASLEGLAETLNSDVHRYRRYYRSENFGGNACRSAEMFYNHAKSLHQQVAGGTDLERLQTSCESMVRAWTPLSDFVTAMPNNGLTGNRYRRVDSSRQHLMRVVAELAGMINRV